MIIGYINKILGTAYETNEEALEALVQKDFLDNHVDTTRDFILISSLLISDTPPTELYVEGLRNMNRLADWGGEEVQNRWFVNPISSNIYDYDSLLEGIGFYALGIMSKRFIENELIPYTPQRHKDFLTGKFNDAVAKSLKVKEFIEIEILTENGNQLVAKALESNPTEVLEITDEKLFGDIVIETSYHAIYGLLLTLLNDAQRQVKEMKEEHIKAITDYLYDNGNHDFSFTWDDLLDQEDELEFERDEVLKESMQYLIKYMRMHRDTELDFSEELSKDYSRIYWLLAVSLLKRDREILAGVAFTIDTINRLHKRMGMF